jgi:carbonic anhydrase
MCETVEMPRDGIGSGRRKFLRTTGVATALGLTSGTFLTGSARADTLTKAQRDKMTPEQIIEVMKKGNERFRGGERKNGNYLREQRASAKG